MLGEFTYEDPPDVLVRYRETYRLEKRADGTAGEVVGCIDCDSLLIFDGETFRCSAACGGPNIEDGLHPSDIDPEYNEVLTMAENGRLMVFTYVVASEDEGA